MPKSEKELRARDAKRDIGQELLKSVHEMKAGRRGRVHKVAVPPITAARLKSGLSQAQFGKTKVKTKVSGTVSSAATTKRISSWS